VSTGVIVKRAFIVVAVVALAALTFTGIIPIVKLSVYTITLWSFILFLYSVRAASSEDTTDEIAADEKDGEASTGGVGGVDVGANGGSSQRMSAVWRRAAHAPEGGGGGRSHNEEEEQQQRQQQLGHHESRAPDDSATKRQEWSVANVIRKVDKAHLEERNGLFIILLLVN
jgi:hypothetical protein